jgi:hypothetical protein
VSQNPDEANIKESKSFLKGVVKFIKYTVYVASTLLVILIVIAWNMDVETQSAEKRYSFSADGSEAQAYLINLIKETEAKFNSSDTDGKRKFYWIQASQTLCGSNVFDVNGLQQGWLGQLEDFDVRDDGGFYVSFEIGAGGNKVVQEFDPGVPARLGFEVALLKMKENQLVRFGGRFVRGKMSENECISAGFDSNPELLDERFRFNFARIELID